jgi:hypothetical protein
LNGVKWYYLVVAVKDFEMVLTSKFKEPMGKTGQFVHTSAKENNTVSPVG